MSDSLGDRIRRIRESKNMTMKEFGELFEPKASKGVVSNWENNYNKPNKKRLEAIANLGKIGVDKLLYGNFEVFAFKVISEDIEKEGELYKYFVDRYSRFNQIDPNSIDKSFVLNYLSDNKDEWVRKTLSVLQVAEKNRLLNMKLTDEVVSNEVIITPEKIIIFAKSYIRSKFKVQESFDEHYQQVKKAIDFLPYSATQLTMEQLYEQFLKQGYEPKQAAAYAKDKYYISEASMLLDNFQDELEQLLTEYHKED